MKSFVRVAVTGVACVALLKLFVTFFIPLFGMVLGLLALTVKLAAIAAVVWFVWSILRPRRGAGREEGVDLDEKNEIVVEEEAESDGE